jgi:ABC-type sugar transport system permease subunit
MAAVCVNVPYFDVVAHCLELMLNNIIYKVGFGELRQGYGTALALVLFLLILIVSIVQIRLLRKREVQL